VPEPHSETDYDMFWPSAANENLMTFRKWSKCRPGGRWAHPEDFICVVQYMRLIHEGDSGGPLMVNRKGIWFEVGVVSTGSSSEGQGRAEFVRVTTHCKWIKKMTQGEVKCVKI
ncbi:serine protease 45, partial [Aphelenchoides avenae]